MTHIWVVRHQTVNQCTCLMRTRAIPEGKSDRALTLLLQRTRDYVRSAVFTHVAWSTNLGSSPSGPDAPRP